MSIGLQLEDNDDRLVYEAFKDLDDHAQSTNQSLSYIRDTPLLVDLELKKSNSKMRPSLPCHITKANYKYGKFGTMNMDDWRATSAQYVLAAGRSRPDFLITSQKIIFNGARITMSSHQSQLQWPSWGKVTTAKMYIIWAWWWRDHTNPDMHTLRPSLEPPCPKC